MKKVYGAIIMAIAMIVIVSLMVIIAINVRADLRELFLILGFGCSIIYCVLVAIVLIRNRFF